MSWQRALRWLPAIAYMTLIYYSSSQSDPAPALTRNISDKLLHSAGYAVLALLYVFALWGEKPTPSAVAAGAIVLTMLYAASDEFHQRFTPGRFSEIADWIADSIGGAVAAGSWMVSKVSRPRRRLPP